MKRLFLLSCVFLGMSCCCFAQTKKLQVEEDGFEWYKVDDIYLGAQDKKGNTIIPCKYEMIEYNGSEKEAWKPKVFIVRDWGKHYGIYTTDGRCIIPTSKKYTSIDAGFSVIEYHVNKDGIGCGICDRNGRELVFIDGIDGIVSCRKDGEYKYYQILKNNLWGVADLAGNIVIEPQYKSVEEETALAAIKAYSATSSASSSSSSTSSTYVFEFNSYLVADTKIYEKATVSISKSGKIKFTNSDIPHEFKCTSIKYSDSYISFCYPGSVEYLTMYRNGSFVYNTESYFLYESGCSYTVSGSEKAKNAYGTIWKEVNNKTFIPSALYTKE